MKALTQVISKVCILGAVAGILSPLGSLSMKHMRLSGLQATADGG